MMGEYCPVEMSFIVGKSTCCKNKNFCTGEPEEDFQSNYDLGKGSRLRMKIFKLHLMTISSVAPHKKNIKNFRKDYEEVKFATSEPKHFELTAFVLIASCVLFVLIMSIIFIGVKNREKSTKYDQESMPSEENSELID